MRGRNRNGNKGPNPLTRTYESNGPDVKIRGTAQHIAEKYSQLARDASASGDPVAAENYFQHAEHYFRIIAAAQEQLREQYGYQQRSFDDEGEDEGFAPGERQPYSSGEETDPGSQPQPFETRPEGDRPARFDREDRQNRGDRRERFQRERGQRQDGAREEQPRLEFDRQERGERQDRGERNGRAPFRRDRQRDEAEAQDAGGLPAFLTNPVRAPVADTSVDEAAPAPQDAANDEEARPRRRTRRPRRALAEDAGSEAAAGFEGIETPAAE
ncbi:DUF4167 domain-containing protein [Microvirga thermotolerans]|nr:DUF4167 domain-containing protein [Microvirga thermotolerans]